MTAQYLIFVSALIIGLLGLAHFILTYSGPKLLPRDRSLRTSMEQTHLVITTQTTLWRAWIGFNASHSLGAILFGLVYGYLSLFHSDFLFESWFLIIVGAVVLLVYVILAKLYWFISPQLGMGLSLVSYVFGIVFSRISG